MSDIQKQCVLSGTIQSRETLVGNIMETVLKGLSAYEVAVKDGFDGTEEEWLQSLVGESVVVTVVKDTQEEYILKFTVGETSVITPNLKGNVELTPQQLEEIVETVYEAVIVQTDLKYVQKENGKSLVSDAEIERLGTLHNYDDTEIKEEINDKVDKVEGKSLLLDTEIERLANVDNYDDTEIKEEIEDKVDKVEGKSLISNTEIERLANVDNYDDTNVKSDISNLQKDKVDKVDGYSLVSDTEKTTWNNKSDFSGSYEDLSNLPQEETVDIDFSNYFGGDN